MDHLIIEPKTKKVKKLMILLHGLGSDGLDMLNIANIFSHKLDDTYFYAPNGIELFDQAPIGYQWFSLKNRDETSIRKELEDKYKLTLNIIEQKLNELKLGYKDLILVGFSQGCMLALYITLSLESKLLSTVGFSGSCILPYNLSKNNTPICLIHGTDDDVVDYSNLNISKDKLMKNDYKVDTLSVSNLKHSIDMEGISFAENFIVKNYSNK